MIRLAHIANERPGGLWWRVPSALLVWLLWAVPLCAAATALVIVRDYAVDLPAAPDLRRGIAALPHSSVIVAADRTVLASLPFRDGPAVGHRTLVSSAELPMSLVWAVLAAEDVRFLRHRGVNLRAVLRAAWANYRAKEIVEGASTITQQLARNLYPELIGSDRSVRRKVREALLSRRIERRNSKQTILLAYVNHVFLGAGAYGVAAAARLYFDKSVQELSMAEAATIAGLIQAPSRLDPSRGVDAARARRDEVLRRMEGAGFIDAVTLGEALQTPLELRVPAARYGTLAPWHTEHVRKTVAAAGDSAFSNGLLLETAVRLPLDFQARERVAEWIAALGEDREHGSPQLAALLWDHQTNYVEYVQGGRDWHESVFDRALQACRQPGSAFKPIVFAAALAANEITAGTPLRDAPIAEYDRDLRVHWKPTNSGRPFRGVALAQHALAYSLNAPAVDVLGRVGGAKVIAMARRLGITTPLADVKPLALGASCVIPVELVGAFASIARGGTAGKAIFIKRIRRGLEAVEDSASFFDPYLTAKRRLDRALAIALDPPAALLSAEDAFIMKSMLRDVVRRGTGRAAATPDLALAGKTGTTNGNSDAWFVGFSPRLAAAVWIGHDDARNRLGPRDDGARAALPLWRELVVMAESDRKAVELDDHPPPSLVRVAVDEETGLLAQPGAGGAARLYFKQGSEPTEMAGRPSALPADLGRATQGF